MTCLSLLGGGDCLALVLGGDEILAQCGAWSRDGGWFRVLGAEPRKEFIEVGDASQGLKAGGGLAIARLHVVHPLL